MTTKSNHTPGPWLVDGSPRGIKIWSDEKGRSAQIASITPRPEDEANAHLIAQAPDLLRQRDELLAACKGILAATRNFTHPADAECARIFARQAIAKAEKSIAQA